MQKQGPGTRECDPWPKHGRFPSTPRPILATLARNGRRGRKLGGSANPRSWSGAAGPSEAPAKIFQNFPPPPKKKGVQVRLFRAKNVSLAPGLADAVATALPPAQGVVEAS